MLRVISAGSTRQVDCLQWRHSMLDSLHKDNSRVARKHTSRNAPQPARRDLRRACEDKIGTAVLSLVFVNFWTQVRTFLFGIARLARSHV